MTDRLYRHPTDRVIAGVAGGMAAWLDIDPSLVRIGWVLLALLSGGALVIVYIVMLIVVPMPPPGWIPRRRGSGGPHPGAVPGWQPGGPDQAGGWPAAGPPAGWGAGAPGGATGTPGWTPADPGSAPGPASTGNPAPSWGTPPPGGWPAQPPAFIPPRPGNAGLVAGVVLVVLGVWFLVDQYVRIDWDIMWPVLIMLGGGALIAGALMRGRGD